MAASLALGALVAAGTVAEVSRPRLAAHFEAPAWPMWTPRLAMAGVACAGALAVFLFVARVVDRRAGVYAAIALFTTPLWFVHGRCSTGAMVPMAAEAAVLAGLGLAALDPRASTPIRAAAAAGAVLATVAAAAARPTCGLAPLIVPPLLGIGLAARGRAGKLLAAAGTLGALVAVGALATRPESVAARLLVGPDAARAASFDAVVSAVAYPLLPWSPLVALAFARFPADAARRAIVLTAVFAVAAHALAPRGALFVGVASLSAALAVALRDIDSAVRPAPRLALTVLVLGVLLARDVELQPERLAAVLGARDVAVQSAQLAGIAGPARAAVMIGAIVAALALALPRAWIRIEKGLAIAGAVTIAGLAVRAYAYPRLIARLSPGDAFDAYVARRAARDPLGVVGVEPRLLRALPPPIVALDAPESAVRWLLDGPGDGASRRFLALGAADLARVNASYREARGENLPVLAGRAGTVLLGASILAPDESNENPLEAQVRRAPPDGLHLVTATVGERLETVGWALLDDRGRPIDAVRGRARSTLRVAVRVLPGASPLPGHCTFIHVDHSPSRFSAEHRDHPYPMTSWRAGDVFVDDFDVALPVSFGAGRYDLLWGVGVLPCEDDRRMPVTSGPNDQHGRVKLGALEVR